MKKNNNQVSVRVKKPVHSHFHHHKISIDDYESIRYPNLDTKRAVIDKMLADKINDLYRIIDEMEQR